MPVALLFARRCSSIDLLSLPPRPGPRRLPAPLTAVALLRPSRLKVLLASLEQTPPGPRSTTLSARPTLPPAALLIFEMACSTLGRAQGRSLLPEALLRRGSHSSPGRSRSSHQYELNNSIAKIGYPPLGRSGVPSFPASGAAAMTPADQTTIAFSSWWPVTATYY